MPASPEQPPRKQITVTPAEQQFALALKMLKAATDNMMLAFDALLQSKSAQAPADAETEARPGGRKYFGDRALRAVEAGERLREQDGASATSSDAEESATTDQTSSSEATSHVTSHPQQA